MKINVIILTGLSVLLLISGCAQTKLYDYKPATASEKEVFDFFVECDKAVGDKNLEKYMSCYRDDARIRIFIGNYTNIWVSKEELRKRLEDGLWNNWESNKFLNPNISVNGNQATVKCIMPGGGQWVAKHSVELIKENDLWSISKWGYKW